MKLTVSTFLVYKVKKCLLKSGKVSPKRWALYAHDVGNQCPAHGLSMPSTWSLSAHVTGIKRPADGPYLTEIVDTSLLLFLLF